MLRVYMLRIHILCKLCMRRLCSTMLQLMPAVDASPSLLGNVLPAHALYDPQHCAGAAGLSNTAVCDELNCGYLLN